MTATDGSGAASTCTRGFSAATARGGGALGPPRRRPRPGWYDDALANLDPYTTPREPASLAAGVAPVPSRDLHRPGSLIAAIRSCAAGAIPAMLARTAVPEACE